MKLTSFTDKRFADLALAPGRKDDVIASLVELLSRSSTLRDPGRFLADVLARERLVTTGVGHGVAFPHAKSEAVSGVVFAFGRATEDVDFGALDGLPVRLVFLIGAPRQMEPSRIYLNLMARLSFLMRNESNRKLLLSAGSTDDVFRLLDSVK